MINIIRIFEHAFIISFYLIFLTYLINYIYVIINVLRYYNSNDFIYIDTISIFIIALPIASFINCRILSELFNKTNNYLILIIMILAMLTIFVFTKKYLIFRDKDSAIIIIYCILWILINVSLIRNYIYR